MSKSMSIAKESLRSGLQMEFFAKPQFSLMCVSSYSPVPLGSTEDLRTWLQAETHAKQTATPSAQARALKALETNLSRLSILCALRLLSGKIQPMSKRMRRGLLTGLPPSLSKLVTPLRLLRDGRVVWGLTINGKGCLCSPGYPTPTQSDYHGYRCGEGHLTRKSLRQMRLNHFLYLTGKEHLAHSAEFREELMMWPIGWSALKPLATDSYLAWLNKHGKS